MTATAHAAKTEDLVLDAMAPGLTPCARQSWVDEAAACMRRNGVIVIRDAIPAAAIAGVLEDYKVRHDVHMAPGQKKLFRVFTTDPLRAQVPIAIDGPAANPEFFAPPSVLALVQELMGDDVIVGEMGVVISHAGAGPQPAHRDLRRSCSAAWTLEIDLPPFAMTMLVPLLDVSLDMGPTEFWPGSHRDRDETAATAVPAQRSALTAGSVVLVDARTLHRGGMHRFRASSAVRLFQLSSPLVPGEPGLRTQAAGSRHAAHAARPAGRLPAAVLLGAAPQPHRQLPGVRLSLDRPHPPPSGLIAPTI